MTRLYNLRLTVDYWIFILLRAIVLILDNVWCRFTGVASQYDRDGSKSGEVQVFNIIFRRQHRNATLATLSTPQLFATRHEDFYPMEYLERADVSLYTIAGDYIYFVQTKSYLELIDTRRQPFMFVAQNALAEKLVKVHFKDLVEMMESKPKPKTRVIWIYHSTRCGSTALAQAMNSMNDWTVFSEIGWLVNAIPHQLQNYEEISAYMTGEKFYQITKACIKAQLMHYPDDAKICWKTNCCSEAYLLPLITKEFPDHKLFFLIRQGEKTTESLYRLFKDDYLSNLMATSFKYLPTFVLRNFTSAFLNNFYILSNGMHTPEVLDFWFNSSFNVYCIFYTSWITTVALLRDISRSHPDLSLMLIEYETYMEDLETNLKKVFEYADIPQDNFNSALDAYKEDSQASSILSQVGRKGMETWQLDEATFKACDKLAKSLGLKGYHDQLTKGFFGDQKNWVSIMN